MSSVLNRHAFADRPGTDERLLGPLLYVFLDTSDLAVKRQLMEDVLGLVAVEHDPHAPHEHHGVVKYDAGPLLIALNIGARRTVPPWQHALSFATHTEDPSTVVTGARRLGSTVDAAAGRFADPDGHVFSVSAGATGAARTVVDEICLFVHSAPAALAFYRNLLGFTTVTESPGCAVVSTGNLRLRLREPATGDAGQLDRRGYLVVFHTHDLRSTRAELQRRGVQFRSRVEDTEIGLTCRMIDPDHHTLCLYEPSAETFTWGAGAKMTEIIGQV